MKKSLLILLISLLPTMWCSSQNIYPKLVNDSLIVITPQQLKATNLIFLEHKKLKLEIPELKKQLTSYESLIKSYEKTDSIKNAQIERLMLHAQASEQVIQSQIREINKLELKKKFYRGLTTGGFTISAVLLITLLLK